MITKMRLFPVMERWPFRDQKVRSVRDIIQGLAGWVPPTYTSRPTADVPELFETLLRRHFNTRLRRSWIRVRCALGCSTETEELISRHVIHTNGWVLEEKFSRPFG